MILSFILKVLSSMFFFTGKVARSKTFVKPLSAEEERECFKRLEAGEKEAEEKLVKHNLRLVAHVSRKYQPPASFGRDDLISVGSIGLLKAVRTYKIENGNTFSTYAARCIENEILMLLRSQKKHAGNMNLESSVGRDKDGEELRLMDVLASDEDAVEDVIGTKVDYENIVRCMSKCLNDKEKYVLENRFGINGGARFTQDELAVKMGISRSYVSRLESDGVKKLQQYIQKRF